MELLYTFLTSQPFDCLLSVQTGLPKTQEKEGWNLAFAKHIKNIEVNASYGVLNQFIITIYNQNIPKRKTKGLLPSEFC